MADDILPVSSRRPRSCGRRSRSGCRRPCRSPRPFPEARADTARRPCRSQWRSAAFPSGRPRPPARGQGQIPFRADAACLRRFQAGHSLRNIRPPAEEDRRADTFHRCSRKCDCRIFQSTPPRTTPPARSSRAPARAYRGRGGELFAVAGETHRHDGNAAHMRVKPRKILQRALQRRTVVPAGHGDDLAFHEYARRGEAAENVHDLFAARVADELCAQLRIGRMHGNVQRAHLQIADALQFTLGEIRTRDIIPREERKTRVVILKIERFAQSARQLVNEAEYAPVGAAVGLSIRYVSKFRPRSSPSFLRRRIVPASRNSSVSERSYAQYL